MVATPERDTVQLHPQERSAVRGHEPVLRPQPAGRANRKRVGSRQVQGIPRHRSVRIGLHRHQQPAIGLRNSRGHLGCRYLALRFRLPHLLRGEIEVLLIGDDRLPSQEAPYRLIELLEAGGVGGEEYQRVAVDARRITARLQNCLRLFECGAFSAAAVRVLDADHDEPRVHVVGHVLT